MEIRPTEDPDRVRKALTNIFVGEVEIKGEIDDYGSAKLVGDGPSSLERFRMILLRDRIRAAGRSQLFKGLDGNRIVTFLNKQVAYANHISFSAPEGESPLGPIRLSIESDDPVQLIEWLTGGRSSERKERKTILELEQQ